MLAEVTVEQFVLNQAVRVFHGHQYWISPTVLLMERLFTFHLKLKHLMEVLLLAPIRILSLVLFRLVLNLRFHLLFQTQWGILQLTEDTFKESQNFLCRLQLPEFTIRLLNHIRRLLTVRHLQVRRLHPM